MSRKIKLVWDFYGGDAKGTAEHHVIHLKQFMDREGLTLLASAVEESIEIHYMATMTVNEEDVLKLRDALKPHRAFVVKQ